MLDKLLSRMSLFLWLSIALTALFPVAALGTKIGLWHFSAAFALLAGLSVTGAVLLAIVGFGLVASINRGNQTAKHSATAAVLILILPMAYVFSNLYKAKSLPLIHDISTDVTQPPQFQHAPSLRTKTENSLEWNTENIEAQQQAYGDIKTIYLAMPVTQAWELVEKAIMQLPWELTYHNQEAGLFEATSTSFWFGFVDDIAIRVQADGDKSKVDVRSISRVGESDLGKNAQRIRFFRQTVKDLSDR
ncbi:MAG: DUF1499 domain-containing protein [Pseudomonadales bacterium]|nr:DUF1499 domain-containing protein [Pseudomonadales bacterium]